MPIIIVSSITVTTDIIIFAVMRVMDFSSGVVLNYVASIPFRLYGGLMIEPFLEATRTWVLQMVIDAWEQILVCAVFGVLLMIGLFFVGFFSGRMIKHLIIK